MRKKSIVLAVLLVLLTCISSMAEKKEKPEKWKSEKDAVYLEVVMTVVNYSPVDIDVTPSGQGGGGPNLFIYSAKFSAFNPVAEDTVLGSVLSPNRYGNSHWITKYTLTWGEELIELGDFTIWYLTSSDGIATVNLHEDNLPSKVVEIDGKYYDLLTTVYSQNIMVMIIPSLP